MRSRVTNKTLLGVLEKHIMEGNVIFDSDEYVFKERDIAIGKILPKRVRKHDYSDYSEPPFRAEVKVKCSGNQREEVLQQIRDIVEKRGLLVRLEMLKWGEYNLSYFYEQIVKKNN